MRILSFFAEKNKAYFTDKLISSYSPIKFSQYGENSAHRTSDSGCADTPLICRKNIHDFIFIGCFVSSFFLFPF